MAIALHLKYHKADSHLARQTNVGGGHLVYDCECAECAAGTTPDQVTVTFADVLACAGCFLYNGNGGWWAMKWTTAPNVNGAVVAIHTDADGPCQWWNRAVAVTGALDYWGPHATAADALAACAGDPADGSANVTLGWFTVIATGGAWGVFLDLVFVIGPSTFTLHAFQGYSDPADPFDCSAASEADNEQVVGDCGDDTYIEEGHYGGTATVTPG